MRKLALLGFVLLFWVSWTAAQTNAAPSSSMDGNIQETTIQGCLGISSGIYTLTLPSGTVFHLTGNTALLKAHVGDTVQVRGVASPVMHVPGSMSEGTQSSPTLSVTSFQRISGTCEATSNAIP